MSVLSSVLNAGVQKYNIGQKDVREAGLTRLRDGLQGEALLLVGQQGGLVRRGGLGLGPEGGAGAVGMRCRGCVQHTWSPGSTGRTNDPIQHLALIL